MATQQMKRAILRERIELLCEMIAEAKVTKGMVRLTEESIVAFSACIPREQETEHEEWLGSCALVVEMARGRAV